MENGKNNYSDDEIARILRNLEENKKDKTELSDEDIELLVKMGLLKAGQTLWKHKWKIAALLVGINLW
ncbi:MAG: hypothetical protein J6M05_03190 [Cardiobacteriaceae bacterium]|nr:hypothetical protein [Cardiobacteriaceae bacterium]